MLDWLGTILDAQMVLDQLHSGRASCFHLQCLVSVKWIWTGVFPGLNTVTSLRPSKWGDLGLGYMWKGTVWLIATAETDSWGANWAKVLAPQKCNVVNCWVEFTKHLKRLVVTICDWNYYHKVISTQLYRMNLYGDFSSLELKGFRQYRHPQVQAKVVYFNWQTHFRKKKRKKHRLRSGNVQTDEDRWAKSSTRTQN